MRKDKSCSQHEICTGSESNAAICKCWCAECKEIMSDIRKAYELSIKAAI